eukprot:3846516-Rhodomonas_salina.3
MFKYQSKRFECCGCAHAVVSLGTARRRERKRVQGAEGKSAGQFSSEIPSEPGAPALPQLTMGLGPPGSAPKSNWKQSMGSEVREVLRRGEAD